MKIVKLCGGEGCCPVVEIDRTEVRIGEKGNLCVLKKEEFDALKEKILSGEL